MRGVRLSKRKVDFLNIRLAKDGCEHIHTLLNQFEPAVFDRIQQWLRERLDATESYLRRLGKRDDARKARWGRFPKPNRESAAFRQAHLEQVAERRWCFDARRRILRQFGDALAWMMLRGEMRMIQPLFAHGRNHQRATGLGAAGPQRVITQAHQSGKFFVLESDLTRCIGVGDIIVRPAHDLWVRPLVYEIKTKKQGEDTAIWLYGAKPTTPLDWMVQADFCLTIGLEAQPQPALRPREQRQAEEVKASTYRLTELLARVRSRITKSDEAHWELIGRVLDRARVDGWAYDFAEPGVMYAGVRNAPGDAGYNPIEIVISRVIDLGFRPDAGANVAFSLDLNDPEREVLSSGVTPIALWNLPIQQRSDLLNDVLILCCFYQADVWRVAFRQQGINLREEVGWWRLESGDSAFDLDPHEVTKLRLHAAFGASSPQRFAEIAREILHEPIHNRSSST